jgi:phosphoribosyl 1,2-cyclic phosphate phosphodiesterase
MAAMSLELLFLGTGTSAGIPMIGCACAVCRSADPRDRRSRPSAVVRYPDATVEGGRQLLIDTAPELRTQAIENDLTRIDGVLYTHGHADHIFGLDDLRRFNAVMKTAVDIYAERSVLDQLQRMFQYVFEPHNNINQSFVATLIARPVEPEVPLDLFGAMWTPLRLLHGRLPILGFRVDYQGQSLAYCTDLSAFPPHTFSLLTDLDVLVIDGLRYRHHPTHLTVDQALGLIDQIGPRQAYLTHIAHDICHAELQPRLPQGVWLAYDGLVVSCATEKSHLPQR